MVKDEIVTHSTGFIKKYEVLSEKKVDSLTILNVRCAVDSSPIKEIIRKKDIQTWDTAIADLALVQQIQKKIWKLAALLSIFIGSPSQGTEAEKLFYKAYQPSIVGYEIESVGLNKVKGNYLVQISLNHIFWDQYKVILEAISVGDGKGIVKTFEDGLFSPTCDRSFSFSMKIPEDLKIYTMPNFTLYYFNEKEISWPFIEQKQISTIEQISISRNGLISSMGETIFLDKITPCYCEFIDKFKLENYEIYNGGRKNIGFLHTPLLELYTNDKHICHLTKEDTYVYSKLQREKDFERKAKKDMTHVPSPMREKLKFQKEYYKRVNIFDNKQLFFINDSVTVKIQFQAKTHEEIEIALRHNKIPWVIFSGSEVERQDFEEELNLNLLR